MKNMTTKDFCRKFRACREGTRFALKFETMRECYAALLRGEAGQKSADWAIWAATRPGVMPDRELLLFSVKCVRRVRHLMADERSIQALDVAERYANGAATYEELDAADAAAWAALAAAWAALAAAHAAWDAAAWAALAAAWAALAAAQDAADAAAQAAAHAAWDAADAASADEREEQLKLLAEYGNPFEGAEK